MPHTVVLAVVLTPEGLPLAYEVMPGNTGDKTTLKLFLEKIQAQYGQAKRIWIMDRGIPTEETLRDMRQSDPPVSYLVGTPRARWAQFKEEFEKLPWQKLRDTVAVKLLAQGDEVDVLAKSEGRRAKETAIRRRKLAKLLRTLRALRRTRQRPWKRDTLLHKLGAAHKEAGQAWQLRPDHGAGGAPARQPRHLPVRVVKRQPAGRRGSGRSLPAARLWGGRPGGFVVDCTCN